MMLRHVYPVLFGKQLYGFKSLLILFKQSSLQVTNFWSHQIRFGEVAFTACQDLLGYLMSKAVFLKKELYGFN